jgi:hypothetical protein
VEQDLKELPIPPNALADPRAKEVLRAWAIEDTLEVAFNREWDDPALWGVFLVILARHAAQAYARDGLHSEAEALDRIKTFFHAEWEAGAEPQPSTSSFN